MYAKNVAFPSGLFCNYFVEGETKELYCVLSNFCIRYFSKMKRKPVKQKIDKCFPIDL